MKVAISLPCGSGYGKMSGLGESGLPKLDSKMTHMRSFAPFAFILVGAVFLVCVLRSRRPGRLVGGWQIVEWGLPMRGVAVALSATMSAAAIVLLGAIHKDSLLAIVLIALVAGSISYVLYFWRNWLKYKDGTIIVCSTWGRPQTIRLSDLKFTGRIGPRGYEYSTADGNTIYINPYQRGAKALIELIANSDRASNSNVR